MQDVYLFNARFSADSAKEFVEGVVDRIRLAQKEGHRTVDDSPSLQQQETVGKSSSALTSQWTDLQQGQLVDVAGFDIQQHGIGTRLGRRFVLLIGEGIDLGSSGVTSTGHG
jgi:hypothetical protein